jgi:penicillin-binding protein 1B
MVVWVGRDDNSPTGLTGSTGALRIWSDMMSGLPQTSSFRPVPSRQLDLVWLDYQSGQSTYNGCGDAVQVPMPVGSEPPRLESCPRGWREFRDRARRWFDTIGQ